MGDVDVFVKIGSNNDWVYKTLVFGILKDALGVL